MEIALITIPGLQFNDIAVFQEWFPKQTNSFVMNPLHFLRHFLISILLIHATWLGVGSSFRISDGWNRASCEFKVCTWKIDPLSHLEDVPPLIPVVNLLLWGIAWSFNLNAHFWIITSFVSFCRYITNNSRVAFSLLFSIYISVAPMRDKSDDVLWLLCVVATVT